MRSPRASDQTQRPTGGIIPFFALACGVTWTADLPHAYAVITGAAPPSYALALVGLGALGPSLAALCVAGWRHELAEVFGRWQTYPGWVVLGFLYPAARQMLPRIIDWALGGDPQWLYPPTRPEHVVAMVMFALGEEFGWRGFAYPRLAARYGPVLGSLVLGGVWGLWHAGMVVTREAGGPDPAHLLRLVVSLALGSVVIAWFFERAGRSIAVPIAIHAGAHLDNFSRTPGTPTRVWLPQLLMLLAVAIVAGWSLRKGARPRSDDERKARPA